MDGVRGVMPQPVVGSPSATGARGGGGGSPEWSQRRCALDLALEDLDYSANYVYMCAGEQEVQWGGEVPWGGLTGDGHGGSTEQGSCEQCTIET